jgi:hypothetical protein
VGRIADLQFGQRGAATRVHIRGGVGLSSSSATVSFGPITSFGIRTASLTVARTETDASFGIEGRFKAL